MHRQRQRVSTAPVAAARRERMPGRSSRIANCTSVIARVRPATSTPKRFLSPVDRDSGVRSRGAICFNASTPRVCATSGTTTASAPSPSVPSTTGSDVAPSAAKQFARELVETRAFRRARTTRPRSGCASWYSVRRFEQQEQPPADAARRSTVRCDALRDVAVLARALRSRLWCGGFGLVAHGSIMHPHEGVSIRPTSGGDAQTSARTTSTIALTVRAVVNGLSCFT